VDLGLPHVQKEHWLFWTGRLRELFRHKWMNRKWRNTSQQTPWRPEIRRLPLPNWHIYRNNSETFCHDISVDIPTRYGLEVRGLNPGEGEIFRTRPDQLRGAPKLLHNTYRVSFPWVKRSGRGANHPPTPSNAEVKERVELYLYSRSGPSGTVAGRNCTRNIYRTQQSVHSLRQAGSGTDWVLWHGLLVTDV
jgi:hypothetical protein